MTDFEIINGIESEMKICQITNVLGYFYDSKINKEIGQVLGVSYPPQERRDFLTVVGVGLWFLLILDMDILTTIQCGSCRGCGKVTSTREITKDKQFMEGNDDIFLGGETMWLKRALLTPRVYFGTINRDNASIILPTPTEGQKHD